MKELTDSFHNVIENYLTNCKVFGKKPEKEFKGTFNIRISPEAHREAALEAAREGITMNQFIATAIEDKLSALRI